MYPQTCCCCHFSSGRLKDSRHGHGLHDERHRPDHHHHPRSNGTVPATPTYSATLGASLNLAGDALAGGGSGSGSGSGSPHRLRSQLGGGRRGQQEGAEVGDGERVVCSMCVLRTT